MVSGRPPNPLNTSATKELKASRAASRLILVCQQRKATVSKSVNRCTNNVYRADVREAAAVCCWFAGSRVPRGPHAKDAAEAGGASAARRYLEITQLHGGDRAIKRSSAPPRAHPLRAISSGVLVFLDRIGFHSLPHSCHHIWRHATMHKLRQKSRTITIRKVIAKSNNKASC